MSDLSKKLNIKNDDDSLLIVNPIYGFIKDLEAEHDGDIHTELEDELYNFILIFGTLQFELEELAHRYSEYLTPGGVLWLAYPKKSSTNFGDGDCSKGTLWNVLKDYDFEALRDISLTEDFNAIRYRSTRMMRVSEDTIELQIEE